MFSEKLFRERPYSLFAIRNITDIMSLDLFIRCSNKTRKRFRHFFVEYGFKNYEEALEELLRLAEAHPDLVQEKRIRWG